MDRDQAEAFREYVAGRSVALLRTAYLLTGNRPDAEDLLQAALAKTWLAWGRIRDPAAVDAYVRRVIVNTRTSLWRRPEVNEYSTENMPELPGRDRTADLDLHDALWQALERLPRRQRAAVVLRYYEDLTEAETADALGITVGTVKSTVSRALKRLRHDAGLRDDPRADLPHSPIAGATP